MENNFELEQKRIEDLISKSIQESIDVKTKLLSEEYRLKIEIAAGICITALAGQLDKVGKILFVGNGGSAADAQHLAAELSGRYLIDRDPIPAEALHVNSSYMTAVANDYSFDEVYARMINAFGNKKDVLVAISTSGNSKNIIRAIEEAKKRGMKVIGMTGESGGLMKDMCDILLNVPSNSTPRIQECHIMVGHIMCDIIESYIFGYLLKKNENGEWKKV